MSGVCSSRHKTLHYVLPRRRAREKTTFRLNSHSLALSFGRPSLLAGVARRQALLINSANLMGGSSEPDGVRGFGRIHLDAGMPLAGNGSLVLFVADSYNTTIPELTRQEYNFTIDGDAGLDLRATLSWIDPPTASTFSAVQLVHDLDLAVVSPSGVKHTMWASGDPDVTNVNERVVVDVADVESGVWRVWVWANRLGTDVQSYSLVVNGAITAAAAEGAAEGGGGSTTSWSDLDEEGFPGLPSSSPTDDEPGATSSSPPAGDDPAATSSSSPSSPISDSLEGEVGEAGSSSGWRVVSPTASSLCASLLVCVVAPALAAAYAR